MRYWLFLLLFSFSFQTIHADEIDLFAASEPPPILRHNIVLNGNLAGMNDGYQNFTVFLSIYSSDGRRQSTCTGIIIAQDMILTAGHCLKYEGLKIKIQFGNGGAQGFTHSIWSGAYISLNPHPLNSSSVNWVNGFLTFDEDGKKKHFVEILARKKLFNYAEQANFPKNLIQDFAVIRFAGVPFGYAPIEYAKVKKLKYRQKVYHVGFGTNSRKAVELTTALRWSNAELTGFFKDKDEPVIGLETFSQSDQQSCFGDSGGPLVIREGSIFKLIGVNAFAYNNCANSNWYMSVAPFSTLINKAILKLRALVQT